MLKMNRRLATVGTTVVMIGSALAATAPTASAEPPPTPTLLSVTPSSTGVMLRWSAVRDADVHAYNVTDGTSIRPTGLMEDDTTFMWTGPDLASSKCFHVRAVNSFGEAGAWSPPMCATTITPSE